MGERGLDALIAVSTSDLGYLMGHVPKAIDLPTFLVIPAEGQPTLLIAKFEEPSLPDFQGGIETITYEDSDGPFALLAQLVPGTTVAISNRTWAAAMLRVQSELPHVTFLPADAILRELRMCKDEAELQLLREAGHRTDRAIERLLSERFEGTTESSRVRRLKSHLADEGLDAVMAIIASGPNSASPQHCVSERVIQSGDMVVIDCGGVYCGYYSDAARTIYVGRGQPTAAMRSVHDTVRRAQQTAVSSVVPGAAAESVDKVARDIIREAGHADTFMHRTGHGVGLDVHEEPFIVAGDATVLRQGMVFTVEPGVYVAGHFGVRIEDTVAVTADGVETFNGLIRDVLVLP
jgi:Xaa-Pro aminopeptidase